MELGKRKKMESGGGRNNRIVLFVPSQGFGVGVNSVFETIGNARLVQTQFSSSIYFSEFFHVRASIRNPRFVFLIQLKQSVKSI
jgi:hypothetical protein